MGVPQGSILGPLLFITMYISNLLLSCLSVSCQTYADDSVIYLSAKTASKAAHASA